MHAVKAFIAALVLIALAVWHIRSEAAGTKDPGYASIVIIATLVTLLTAF